MTRGILITGAESSLSLAIAAEAGRRVEKFSAAFIPDLSGERSSLSSGGGNAGGEGKIIPLLWNPASPISARSLVMAAESHLGSLDEAFLVCTPPPIRKSVEELSPAEIDRAIDNYLKGWFFLAKELSSHFIKKKRGTLILVLRDFLSQDKGDQPDLAGPVLSNAFRSLGQALLAPPGSSPRPYTTLAFSCDSGEDGDFAAFIFKTLDEGGRKAEGKWNKFGRGLFRL